MSLVPSLAFGMPSAGEWMLILVIGVMIYGRRLPEVGRQVGRTFARLRRGYDEFRRELDRDESLREVRTGIRDMRGSLDTSRRALDPRRMLNPGQMINDAIRSEADPDGAHPPVEDRTESWHPDPGHPDPYQAAPDPSSPGESKLPTPEGPTPTEMGSDTVDEPADEARRDAPPTP